MWGFARRSFDSRRAVSSYALITPELQGKLNLSYIRDFRL
jgi:hypothetical protein